MIRQNHQKITSDAAKNEVDDEKNNELNKQNSWTSL